MRRRFDRRETLRAAALVHERVYGLRARLNIHNHAWHAYLAISICDDIFDVGI